LGVVPVANHEEYYEGENGGFPQVQIVVNFMSFMSPCMSDSFVHQKCSIYALTN
jgi:hypothetical protein